ncbi:hypothetical protein, partial [Actinobacillus pleuropneumoniae]|uniref:hypothetical protein n=1 Tax=Actinobacillus pleuropneumoniae TaxID=715 RepID=UPI00227AD8BD
MGLQEVRKEEEERKEWEEIKKNAGFYRQEVTPSTKARDVTVSAAVQKGQEWVQNAFKGNEYTYSHAQDPFMLSKPSC